MGNNDNRSVVSPLLGSGALGAGAYGSHKLDNYLESIGLPKGLSFNPKAVEAIKAYGGLKPGDISDPSKYIYRYSDLANKASRVQLFNEDPRKTWEWFTNNETMTKALSDIARRGKRTVGKFRNNSLQRFTELASKVLGSRKAEQLSAYIDNKFLRPLQSNLADTQEMLSPVRTKVNRRRTVGGKANTVLEMAHEAEIGKSGKRALMRLMMETMDPSNGLGDPEKLARNTAEAIRRWGKVSYGRGRSFKNALEYFNHLNGVNVNDREYADYINHFKDIMGKRNSAGKPLGRKEVLDEIRKLLAPTTYTGGKLGNMTFAKELKNQLGSTGRWNFDDKTGRIKQNVRKRFSLRDGIRSERDMRRVINNSPILTWMRSGIKYEGTPFGHLFKGLRGLQAARNPKLRLALGLGSAGLGALGLSNLGRNIFGAEQA